MLNNLNEQISGWYEQALHCARQADEQTDPKVKQQFLELERLFGCCWRAVTTDFIERLGGFYDETTGH